IPIDAVFSPIRQVSFKVERAGVAEQARQGQPFEQVKISLTTDGTCSPEAALRQASAQLSQQFTTLSMQPFTRQKPLSAIPYHRSLANLKLQSRTLNALQRNGFHNINSVMKHIRKDGISHIKGLGNKSQDDLLNRLEEQNLSDEDQLILQAIRQGEYKPRPRKQSENVDIEEVR
ncbi:MAG: DNA-directed RNA polymerase subunit alpha C-terminal domain-containing protein, partial [Chloroflexota bacterium]